jgi:hypothetical protein
MHRDNCSRRAIAERGRGKARKLNLARHQYLDVLGANSLAEIVDVDDLGIKAAGARDMVDDIETPISRD